MDKLTKRAGAVVWGLGLAALLLGYGSCGGDGTATGKGHSEQRRCEASPKRPFRPHADRLVVRHCEFAPNNPVRMRPAPAQIPLAGIKTAEVRRSARSFEPS